MKRLLLGLIAVVLVFVLYSRLRDGGDVVSGKNGNGREVVTEDRGQAFSKSFREPFTFFTKRLDVKITKDEGQSLEEDADYLVRNAERCAVKGRPEDYYPKLKDILVQTKKTVYTVSETYAAGQPSIKFYISTVPNNLGYQDTVTFKEDFFQCPGDAGNPQPLLHSRDNLLFVQPCRDDVPACTELNDVVQGSIVFKDTTPSAAE